MCPIFGHFCPISGAKFWRLSAIWRGAERQTGAVRCRAHARRKRRGAKCAKNGAIFKLKSLKTVYFFQKFLKKF